MQHSRRKPLSQRLLAIFLAFLMVFSGGLFSHRAEAAGEPTEVEQVDQGASVNLDNTTGPIDSIEPLVTEESVEPIEPVEPIDPVDPVDPREVENPEDPVSPTAVITATFESKYSTTPEVMTVATAGETVNLPSPAETTVVDGYAEYVFQGWIVENDETIYLAASEYALNTDTTFTAVWAKTTGVMIDLYRFIGEETPVKTEIYRNRTNEATAYTLTNQATGEVINSNPKMSRRETLSFQDVPAGNYTLTMDLPADSAMHHFSVYSNATVTSENTATLVVPQDSGVFTNFSLYLEQDPNLIEYTTLTFDLNGGKLVNPENYTLDEEGNVVFINQKYETFTQREQWIQLHDTKTIYHDNGTYDYWAYRTENGARVNNATVLRNNMIAEGWTDTTLVAVWKIVEPTSYTVTIDPNGGTINEEYRVTEVTPGETYTVPYNFRSGLANSGYTLTGYTVTGTLLDTEGNPVTELSRYTGQYTPQSDVTLTAVWEVSKGDVQIRLYDESPRDQTDAYTLTLTAEDGTEYPLTSNQFGATHRTWRVDDVPNGTYTLTIEGYNPADVVAELTGGQSYGAGSIVVNEDGTYTITLDFNDESPAAFNRFSIQEKQQKISVEVRDLDNLRTDQVTITITDEDGQVFRGSYNEYKQWTTNMTQFATANKAILSAGTYTITLSDLPEDTRAVINDTVATQQAVATDEDNVFTLVVEEGAANTWAAFKLEEYITHTVTIDPNGGTIDEEYRVTVVEDGDTYSVPYTFRSNIANPGYTLTGYTVTGTLLDADGNPVTEITKYPTPYTPQGDVTLTAIWEVTEGNFRIRLADDDTQFQKDKYSLKLVAEDGTEYVLTSNSYNGDYRTWQVDDIPNGSYTLVIEGPDSEILSYTRTGASYVISESLTHNGDMTFDFDVVFEDENLAGFVRYRVEIEEVIKHTVTIDPNGGTIDENYRVTEVVDGETYSVPYTFQSKLANPGYTLAGYTVTGTLLDAEGNAVTEITKYPTPYTPQGDVTLTAIWEVTEGNFRIHLSDDAPALQKDKYALKLVAEDGTEYVLTSNSYGPTYRQWEVDDIPNGAYTLVIEGPDSEILSVERTGGSYVVSESLTDNGDMTLAFNVVFEDEKPTAFVRYRVEIQEVITHTVTIDPNGGTIDEEYRVTEVVDGETYSVPYTFRSNLANPGYTLAGYTVTGTLLDANGNAVTEITKHPTAYTPQGDVTLTAIWAVTDGNVRIHLADEAPSLQPEKYSLKLVAEDGTEYVLTSNSYSADYRQWEVDDVPNGAYTLVIEGPDSEILSVERTGGSYVVSSSLTDNGDMTLAFDVVFEDENFAGFVRYRVEIQETPELLRGWQLIDGNWYYYKEDGTPATDEWLWVEVLDQEGNVIEYNWKYFTPEGVSIDQLYRENGNTWLSQDGPYDNYYKGFWDHPDNEYTYYFREDSGSMVTGWQYINDHWYFFRDTGTMVDVGGFAWVPVLTGGHAWKYFGTDGINDERFYTNELGWVWLSLEGPYEGYHRGWWTDPANGQIYYFRTTSGTRVHGFQFIDGDWRYFREGTGTQAFGWQFIDGSWYYFREYAGSRVTGRQSIDNQWYDFTADGRLIGSR